MLLFKILVWIYSRLPHWLIFPLFGIGARLFFLFNNKKRLLACKNIKTAFPGLGYSAVRRIARDSFLKFGYSIAETFRLPVLSPQYIEKYIAVRDRGLLDSGEPSVMVGVHEGSWEMLNAALASLFPYAILAQEQKGKGFNEYLNRLRRGKGLSVIDTSNLRELVAYFKKGFWIGFAVDQGSEENAEYVEFLGRSMPMPSGAVRFARKFKRDIICGYIQRIRGPYHELKLKKVTSVQVRPDGEILREISSNYENFIRESPSEYLWFAKPFKYARERDVLILDDGRPGHLSQSLGLFHMLQIAKPEYRFREKIALVRFRNDFCRSLAQGLAFLVSTWCASRCVCLRFLLTPESYQAITLTNADVVISTGSHNAAVNVIASSLHQAVCLSVFSGGVPLNKFHAVFSPEHDRLSGRNVVSFNGSIAFKDKETIAREAEDFSRGFALRPAPGVYTIGILIGGDSRDYRQDTRKLKAFLREIDRFAAEHHPGVRLLVSTSRRTTKDLEEFIEELWGKKAYVASMVIANKQNFPWVSGGILGLADLVLVSSDSISMVSESASLKDTFVLEVIPSPRHRIFARTLYQQKYVRLSSTPSETYPLLGAFKDGRISLNRLDNAPRIIEYFKKHTHL